MPGACRRRTGEVPGILPVIDQHAAGQFALLAYTLHQIDP
jgi:hypothetical protein